MNESKQAIVVGAHKTETTEMSKKKTLFCGHVICHEI